MDKNLLPPLNIIRNKPFQILSLYVLYFLAFKSLSIFDYTCLSSFHSSYYPTILCIISLQFNIDSSTLVSTRVILVLRSSFSSYKSDSPVRSLNKLKFSLAINKLKSGVIRRERELNPSSIGWRAKIYTRREGEASFFINLQGMARAGSCERKTRPASGKI